jgi:hypothetical protein
MITDNQASIFNYIKKHQHLINSQKKHQYLIGTKNLEYLREAKILREEIPAHDTK